MREHEHEDEGEAGRGARGGAGRAAREREDERGHPGREGEAGGGGGHHVRPEDAEEPREELGRERAVQGGDVAVEDPALRELTRRLDRRAVVHERVGPAAPRQRRHPEEGGGDERGGCRAQAGSARISASFATTFAPVSLSYGAA